MKTLPLLVTAIVFGLMGCSEKVADQSASLSTASPRSALCTSSKSPAGSMAVDLGNAENLIEQGRAWIKHARLQSDPGFYLNAGACADLALALDPANAHALEVRGHVLMNLHDFAGAHALATTLVAREPTRASAHGLLADAELELGDYDRALATTQRQLSLHPDMGAHARASYLRWLAGDQAGARRLITAALVDRDPQDPEAAAWTVVEAGNLYWHAGDLVAADAIYQEALRWLPGYPSALFGRARVALAQGEPQRAIAALEKSLQQKPLVETAWLLGDAQAAAGDAESAAASYLSAEKIGRRGDRMMLASFLAAKDRNADEALRLADAESRTRSNVYLDDIRAWALYRLGRYREALDASERALRLGTPDARLLFHNGAIRLALDDTVAGTRKLEQALALNPHFDAAAAAQARAMLVQADKNSTEQSLSAGDVEIPDPAFPGAGS